MSKRWLIHHFDQDLVRRIESSSQVSPVVAHLLACRGLLNQDKIKIFLDNKLTGLHDPEELPGCLEAATRIHAAIKAGKKIAIYGDYDADGMTSTAIMVTCLKRLGANVTYHVPSRLDDGYGLNRQALEALHQRGIEQVITVDCGIGSIDHALYAKEVGLELIISDHHQFSDSLPEAAAIVHPRLPGHNYPFPDLCGAGVAFKIAWAVCKLASGSNKVSDSLRQFLFRALGFAAIGTVADVVPLRGENRILVTHGLSCMKESAPLGLQQLMKLTSLDQKSALASEDIAFSIAPRLNASGRLGQAQLGVELLLTESEERAVALADYIQELNGNRDHLDRSIYRAANEMIKTHFDPDEDAAFVLADRNWHSGVIGIVAGRIAEKYNRPTILISLDPAGTKPGMGSARTACGIDLHAALAACQSHLVSFGGHVAAAGLRIEEDKVGDFRSDFCDYVASNITSESKIAELRIDVEAPLSQLTVSTVYEIEKLAPFGEGNPRPLICTNRVELAEPPKRMGAGERHLAVRFQHNSTKIRAVAFGKGEWADELAQHKGPVDIAYRPVINEFNGMRRVELHLVDWRPHAS